MSIEIIKCMHKVEKSIINHWNDISLRIKLILLFLIIITFSSGCITLFLYRATEDAILKQSEKSSTAYLYQISKRLESFMENIHRGTLGIAFNKNLMKDIANTNEDAYEYLDSLMRSIDMIATFTYGNRSIYFMSIYDLRNNILFTSRREKANINLKSEDYNLIRQYFIDNKNKPAYKWIETREINDFGNKRMVLSYIMPINHPIFNNMIGAIITNVKEDDVSRIYSEMGAANNGIIYLVDKQNIIISAVDKSMLGKRLDDSLIVRGTSNAFSYVKQLDGKRCLVLYRKLQYVDWAFIYIIPVKDLIIKNISALQKAFVIFFLIIVLVSFLITSIINILIYKPVGMLVRKLREGNKGMALTDFNLARKDEIGFIFNSFNEVFQENRVLLKNNYEQKLLLKDAEIRLLHSQINSHFLYNSLDAIIWMAKSKSYEKIIVLIKAMGTFFRISLDKGNELTKIAKVKEQLESYFIIQKIRYSNRLKVEIDIDPSIYECRMLKLLLQPIVENSVKHGIEKKKGEGFIKVTGKKEGEMLIFIIEDNGIGVPEEKLEQVNWIINAEEQDANDFSALQNINRRIKLFYGAEYGLKLESHEGQGTTVSMRIPLI